MKTKRFSTIWYIRFRLRGFLNHLTSPKCPSCKRRWSVWHYKMDRVAGEAWYRCLRCCVQFDSGRHQKPWTDLNVVIYEQKGETR